MKLRVLGSYGGDLKGRFPAFLLDDTVLLDAGTIGTVLTLEEQFKIQSILLTHHHIDHMLGIPFFADAVYGPNNSPVQIFSLASVIQNLKSHLMNDVLWPDFNILPTPEHPTVQYNHIEINRDYDLADGFAFHVLPTCHIGASCGYIIHQNGVGLVYSGDTGICKDFWSGITQFQKKNPDIVVKAIIIECSFPSEQNAFANATQHLTPEQLASEVKYLEETQPDLMIFHMKPKYMTVIEEEVNALLGNRIWIMRPDDEYHITRAGIKCRSLSSDS